VSFQLQVWVFTPAEKVAAFIIVGVPAAITGVWVVAGAVRVADFKASAAVCFLD